MNDELNTEPNAVLDLSTLVFSEQIHLRLPSRPDWIESTVDYLKARAVLCGVCHEGRAGKLMVALHEALSNAIVHGNLELSSELKERGDDSFARELAIRAADPALSAREVDVVIDYDGERCRWIITDQGQGFDFASVLCRLESDDPDVLLASGRGILMMRSFMDEVRYELGGRRCVLALRRGSGEERRRNPRSLTLQPLRVVPIRPDGSVDWEAASEAISRNVSESGIGVLQARLAKADRVLIGLVTDTGPLYLPAEIRHWRMLGDNTVELGCRFQTREEQANPEALEGARQAISDLLQDLRERMPHEERRAHPRVVYTERIEVLRPDHEPQIGFARDLSCGGIAFIATAPLPLESVVITLPQGKSTLHVRAQVVRCSRINEGFYDVGARFLALAME